MNKIKIILFASLINFLLVNCTKVEDGYVIPKSAPYILNPLNINDFISSGNRTQQILCATIRDSSWVFQHILKPLVLEEKFKFVSLLYFGIPFNYIEQVNFQNNSFNELESVFLIPYLDDFNKNGTYDQLYFLVYNRHYSIQIRDQNKLIYPKTQLLSNDDLYREIVLSERKLNGFKLTYLGIWKYSQSSLYVMFLKTNRLSATISKETDTLIVFNPYSCELKKFPFNPGVFLDGNGGIFFHIQQTPQFFKSSPKIFFQMIEVKNGHNFNSVYNDFNRYLIVLDTNFTTLFLDTLWSYKEKPIIVSVFIDSSNFYLLKKDKKSTSGNDYYLYQYSLEGKHYGFKKKFNMPLNNVPIISYKLKSNVYLFGGNRLSIVDLTNDKVTQKELPFDILTGYESGLIVGYDFPLSSDFNVFKDLNKDGCPDIICRTGKNQIVGFDFFNDKILFASDTLAKPIDFSIGYSNTREPIVIVYAGGNSNIYLLGKNSFWIRLLANYSILTLLGIVILVPVSTFIALFFFVIYKTLKKITTKNEILGISLFLNIGLKTPILKIYNNTTYNQYIENLTKFNENEKVDSVNSKYFSKSLMNNLERVKRAKTIIWNSFYFDEKGDKYILRFVVTTFALSKLLNFYLVQVYEITDLERKEILFMYTNVLHRIKNGLGAIQSTFENVNYLYERNRLDVQTSKKYLNNVYKMIYRITSNLTNMISISNEYKPSKSIVDINKLIVKWLKRFNEFFYSENIIIETNLANKNLYVYVDENQIFSALDVLLENSINSIDRDKTGIISISTYPDNGKVSLKITDNGVGFDLNLLENKNLINPSKKPYSTGIGLKIARKIFEFHNAKLEIFSEKDKGTTVLITFENYDDREK